MFKTKSLLLHCLLNIGIFSHIACASNSTTSAPSVPNTLNYTECVTKCLHQLLESLLQNDYHDCMGECVNDWPLRYVGGCQDITPLINPEGLASCVPREIWYDEEFVTNRVTNETVGYFKLTWKPCPAGIQDLTGFYVSLQQIPTFKFSCQLLALSRRLTKEDVNTRFTVVFLPKVVNSAHYAVTMRSLPMIDDTTDQKIVPTPACEILNADHLCHCEPLPELPHVNVSGYSVTVTTSPVKECHQIEGYDFIIAMKTPLQDWKSKHIFDVSKSEHVIRTTFQNVFDNIGGFQASVVLLLAHNELRSYPTDFVVKAWVPPTPKVNVVSPSLIEVFFEPASLDYGISTYGIRLSKHIGSSEDASGKVEVVSDIKLKVNPNSLGEISDRFLNLQAGLYSVQVREERKESSLFKATEWGPRQLFDVPAVLHPAIIPVVLIVVVVIALIVVVVIVMVCLWRKEKCLKILHVLPLRFAEALKPRIVNIRKRTVLIVWQADTRSKTLGDLHSAIIRYFAAFLNDHCGFDVILDMFEENSISQSIHEWALHACERADFVIFICPHFEQSVTVGIPPLLGDFNFMFGCLFNELRSNRRRRLITVHLPYSDPTYSSSSKILLQMTRNFQIMENIRSLYFYILGVSPSDLTGDYTVSFINGDDYVKTNEGAGLRDRIIAFQTAHNEWIAAAHPNPPLEQVDENLEAGRIEVPSSPSHEVERDEFLPAHDDPQINRLEIASFFVDHPSECDEEVMEDRLVEAPISDSPLHQQRPLVVPPPPFVANSAVYDAMDEINRINHLQGHQVENLHLGMRHFDLPAIPLEDLEEPDLTLCPYHDLLPIEIPPAETPEPLDDASLGHHSSVYGMDSTSFHCSCHQDPGETSPKSPAGDPNSQRGDSMEAQVVNPRRDRSAVNIATNSDSGFDSIIV